MFKEKTIDINEKDIIRLSEINVPCIFYPWNNNA